jgi:hypothetical protein
MQKLKKVKAYSIYFKLGAIKKPKAIPALK